jgi:predicted dehydrogenase
VEGPDRIADVRAIYDASPQRARREGRRLNCDIADSVLDILERRDVEAVLLCDPPWHGHWTVERAAEAGKPVFSATPAGADANGLDSARRKVRERSLPAMAALPTAIAPAVARLRVLLDKHLGPVRSVCCMRSSDRAVSRLLESSALLSGLHLCQQLIGAMPETVWTAAPEGAGLVNLTLAFPGGRAASVMLPTGPRSSWRTTVVAERGCAEAVLPRRLRWRDAGGQHSLCLPRQRAPLVLLRRFLEAVAAGRAPEPSFEDACIALSWLEAARRSHVEGRPVSLDRD